MRLLIGADIVPTESNISSFSKKEIDNVIDEEVMDLLRWADYRIFNLEAPLADKENPISKHGPNLIIPTECIKGIKKLGVDSFTLANNHIMDHGEQGLFSTQKILKDNNIGFVGVGENLEQAKKPYIFTKDGVSVGIYACAEHEFSIASETSPGANPFDALESFDHICDLKHECDYVIVLYHGGKEHYRYPSPNLQKICRKMCENGADLVVCQHSHCVGCEEKYKSSTIVYGQGNFIFDAHSDEYWDSSLLIQLEVDEEIHVNYIPLEKKNGKVYVSHDENILNGFCERSKQIEDEVFIQETYSEFSGKMLQNYMSTFCGNNIIFRVINKLCRHSLKRKISKKRLLALTNYIECEAHRELLQKGLRAEIKKRQLR